MISLNKKNYFYIIIFTFFCYSNLCIAFSKNKFVINVPYAPGGWSDRVARIISTNISDSIVINTPNKFSNTHQLFESSFSNKQVVITGMGISVTDNVFQNYNYDFIKKFDILIIGYSPNVFLVNKTAESNNISEFRNYLQSKNVDFRFSVSSSFSHISIEEFLSSLNIKGRPIHYKSGGSQSVLAVMNNDVHLVSTNLTTAQSLIDGKILIPIGINTDYRIKQFPNLPTIKEQLGKTLLSKSYTFVNIPKSLSEDDLNYWKKTIIYMFKNENIIDIMEKEGIQVELLYGDKNINDWYNFQNIFYKDIIKKYNILVD
jgi:tripartite-type tricarboxylate transporter receptor subunit TctC